MENIPTSPLKEFQDRQQALILLCGHLLQVLEALDMPALYDEAHTIEQRVYAQTLKILVVGEQGRGKSTVINALLGKKLLPAYPLPTTALRCEIRSGKQPEAILHYRPSCDGSKRPPRVVPDAEFEPLLMADNNQEDHADHEWLEVLSSLPLLNDGIEFIDTRAPFSVSLYDDDGPQEAILPDLPCADIALFVLACDSLPTREESMEIDRLRCADHKTILFLCNRFDLVEPSSQELVRQRFTTYLSRFAPGAEHSIFFTNAKGALAGRLAQNMGQIQDSNMLAVEAHLFHLLTAICGKEKQQRTIGELRTVIDTSARLLPAKKLLLHSESQALHIRQARADRRIEQLEKTRQRIFILMNAVREPMCTEIRVVATLFFLHIAHKIEGWAQAFVPEQPQSMWDIFSGDPRRRLVKELTAFLTEEVHREFQDWTISVLQATLYKEPRRMAYQLECQLHLFVDDLADLLPEAYSPDAISTEGSKGKLVEHVFVPYNRMLAISGQLATMVVEREQFSWHPTVMIARLLQSESIRAALKDDEDRESSIQDAVARAYKHELEATLGQRADAIAKHIDNELRTLQEQLDHTLSLEMQCAHDIINGSLMDQQLFAALTKELEVVRNELAIIWSSLPASS